MGIKIFTTVLLGIILSKSETLVVIPGILIFNWYEKRSQAAIARFKCTPKSVVGSKANYLLCKHRAFISIMLFVSSFLNVNVIKWLCSDDTFSPRATLVEALVVLLTFSIGILRIAASKRHAMSQFARIHFLKQACMNRTGLDIKVWNTIAAEMDMFLYQNSFYSTPCYFYDGDRCQSKFRDMFLAPDAKEAKLNIGMEPFVQEAVELYRKSLNESWEATTGIGKNPESPKVVE